MESEKETYSRVAPAHHPARPPPPPVPKPAPPLPPCTRPPAPSAEVVSEAEEPSIEERAPAPARPSAKQKGKAGKKKGGKAGREEDVPTSKEQAEAVQASVKASAWMVGAEQAIAGCVLQDLLRPVAWRVAEIDADSHLEDLMQRLSLTNPLGFALPLEWKQFVGLEIDGGPKPSSRRNDTPAVDRIQKNAGLLLGHYVSILFLLTLLHALSNFGLLLLPMLLQVGMLLAPPDVAALTAPVRVVCLQSSHALLWVVFVRSLWQMHLFIKGFMVLGVVAHTYYVKPPGED